MTLRVEVYDWGLVGVHQFLGCHTIYIRDHTSLRDTTGKWVELWLVLKKRTSKDKVSGKIHLGIKIDRPPDDDEIAKLVKRRQRVTKRIRPKSVATTEIPTEIDFEVGGIGIVDGRPKKNKAIEFDITPIKDIDEKDVEILLKTPSGEDIPVKFKTDKDGKMFVSYTPNEIGPYQISINHKGKKPVLFDVNVLPAPDPKKCTIKRQILGESERIPMLNEDIIYTVFSNDGLGNPLYVGDDEIEVDIDAPVNGKPRVVDNQNGTYDISFNPKESGPYNLAIKMNGVDLDTIPVIVSGDIDPEMCVFKGDGIDKASVVYAPNTIDIQLTQKDGTPLKFGNPEEFTPVVISPSGKEIPVFLHDNEDGSFQIVYVPEELGDYKLKALVNGKEIVTSFSVKAETDPAKSTVEGPILKGGDLIESSYIPCMLKVQNRDQLGVRKQSGGDQVTAIVSFDTENGPEDIPVKVVDNNDGSYQIKFDPKNPGKYKVKVKVNGEDISSTPFLVPITEGVDIENTTVDGPGLTNAYVGVDNPFVLQARDPECVPVNFNSSDLFGVIVTDQDPRNKDVPCLIQPYVDEGKTPVVFTPKREGLHKIQVQHKGKDIIDPIPVVVQPNANAPVPINTKLSHFPSILNAFEPIAFDICLNDKDGKPIPRGGDDVDVIVEDPWHEVQEIKPKLVDKGNGVYSCQFLPVDVGKHKVRVRVLGKDITAKPLIIDICDAMIDDVPILITRYVDIVLYNKKGKIITKETKDKKILNIYFADKKTGKKTKKVVASRKFNGDGKYRLSYLAKEEGNYTMHILMNEKHVLGSPFQLDISKNKS